MLKTLKIKNVALIEKATINFDEKLNIISGETGAGKSVLLDAVGLILGQKADKTLIKNGEEFLFVEATFLNNNSKKIQNFFEQNNLDFDDCIIISRKISLDGKNEVKINGENVPLMFVKNLSSLLIDNHKQNENYEILNKKKQLALVDSFVEFDFDNLKNLYKNIGEINKKIAELSLDENERNHELDLLLFEINEIENAKLSENEEEELKSELLSLKNAEKIANNLNNIKQSFEGTGGIISSLRKCNIDLANIASLSGKSCETLDRLNGLEIDANDIYEEILEKFDIDFSEDRFEEIDNRLEIYKNMHKKYGILFSDIQDFLEKAKQKYQKLANFGEELEKLTKQKTELIKKAFELCEELSSKRKISAKNFEKQIESELAELAMPNAKIKFVFNNYNLSNFENYFSGLGADDVELMFSANLGEEVKPLSLVASGGEISRLMLAIKTITSQFDDIPTIIFDELDTGISGEASVATSKKLAKISKHHQILAVSHLFQICAMADKNILVKKIEQNGKTVSLPIELEKDQTTLELCRFLSVNGVTESTINHAKEVKEFCENYKKSI